MNKGDSVKVKKGVLEPDTEKFELSDWQGRIVDIDTATTEEGALVSIEWDVKTLQLIPADYIIQSEIEGLGWEIMVLFESDVEITESRDNESDVKKMQEEISDKYYWSWLGEDGLRIAAVLGGMERKDEMICFDIWYKYLNSVLSFPIQAVVLESEYKGLIEEDTKVEITALSTVNDMYGIMAAIKVTENKQDFPLCDLDVMDERSAGYQFIKDYTIWFANR